MNFGLVNDGVIQPASAGFALGSVPYKAGMDLARKVRVGNWMAGLGGHQAAVRFQDCGVAGNGWIGVCENGHRVTHSFTCMLRICPRCALLRSRQLAERLTPAISRLCEAARGEMTLKHIVLGTNISMLDYVKINRKGEPSLDRARLDELHQIMKLMRGCVVDLFKDKFGLVEGFGFAVGVEFGANLILHFHVLALMPYWDQRELSNLWYKSNLHHGNYVWIKEAARDIESIQKTIGYVSKYVTKPMSSAKTENRQKTENGARVLRFLARWGDEIIDAVLWYVFKGMRRFQTYAAFYDLEFQEIENEVCPVCGGKLLWSPEGGAGWIDLNLYKTNKLDGSLVGSEPEHRQLLLFEHTRVIF